MTATQKIPSGYKQTEIGVIPADWDVKKLGDIADINMGQSPDSKNYNLTGHGMPLIQGNADIKNRKSIERVWTTQITKICEVGDLIMTVRAPVGFIGVASENSCIGRGVCSFKAKGVEKNFLYHSLIFSENSWKVLEQGSTFTAANSNQIIGFELLVPSTTVEQSAISTVLSDSDSLIKKLERLIEKKRNIKQGAMQELLTGKRRLPGFSGKWEMKTLGEVVEFEHGRDLPKSDMSDEGIYKCIHYGQLFREYQELVGDIKSRTNSNAGRFYSKANDVLMPTSDVTPRGLATASCIKEDGVILGGGILVIRFNTGYDGLYFSYFISQNKSMILKFVKGSTVFHLYASDLANLEVNFPGPDEQIAIANVLSDMDTEIEKLESQLTKYQNIKQGMMQTLLTGKIRLLTK